MTAKQKAKKQKVPFIDFLPPLPKPFRKEPPKADRLKDFYKIMDEGVSVCACGKEIKKFDRKEPCGKDNCPFGRESNIQLCQNS